MDPVAHRSVVTAVTPGTPTEVLRDYESVHGYVGRVCFKNGPPGPVGAELEWLLAPIGRPEVPVRLEWIADLDHIHGPGGSRVTIEPGAQLELSSPVAPGIAGCLAALDQDIAHVHAILRDRGLEAQSRALDPVRPPWRQVRHPRYDAMQTFFDRRGPAGSLMMTSTAAVQVNLECGADAAATARRWHLLQDLGPTLVAAFANSPRHAGRPTGWKSTRQHTLHAMERCRPVPAQDPVSGWAEAALAAPVMLVRRPDGWLAAPGITFGEWLDGASGLPQPTVDDLAYHLTTLFPPVRPRGWFEVRYLDAQPPGLWAVPVAVLTALADDPYAADAAADAVAPVRDAWETAARCGAAGPALRRAAVRCFELAVDALPRLGAPAAVTAAVADYADRYPARGRCPADDPEPGGAPR